MAGRSAPPHGERRAYPRTATQLHVLFQARRLDRPVRRRLTGIARDLSLGGMFVTCPRPPASGTLVDLEIFPDDATGDTTAVRARGIVRRRRRLFHPRGMAVEFLELGPEDRARLDRWLTALGDD